MKSLVLLACLTGLLPVTSGETKPLQRITAVEAKNHIGEVATVCGKVVGARISAYLVGDRGKPIAFFLDKPEPNPALVFMAVSTDPTKVEQLKTSYQGKQVCVTGRITLVNSSPHIFATELSQIQVQTDRKK